MDLKERIIQVSKETGRSHLGSCLSAVDLIESVYRIKDDKDKFVLSAGHSALALYVVLEKHGLMAGVNINDLSVHPVRDEKHGVDCSTGSLGQGLPIAVGCL